MALSLSLSLSRSHHSATKVPSHIFAKKKSTTSFSLVTKSGLVFPNLEKLQFAQITSRHGKREPLSRFSMRFTATSLRNREPKMKVPTFQTRTGKVYKDLVFPGPTLTSCFVTVIVDGTTYQNCICIYS